MYFMYVDDSGDSGLARSPTDHFILTGMVIHENRWREYLDELVAFRRRMRDAYGLRLRDEIHAAEMLGRSKRAYTRIPKGERLAIIRAFAKQIGEMEDFNIINVVVRKHGKPDTYSAFDASWRALIQRFENTLGHRNFRGPQNPDDMGILFPDHTNNAGLIRLIRSMRHWNPVPNQVQHGAGYRNLALARIAEDPNFRDSGHSYFVQACDTASYLLRQRIAPNSYMRKKGGRAYFRLMDGALCKVAATADPNGIVWL